MTWKIEFLEEAKKDLLRLNHSTQIQVLKGISKVAQNPLPVSEGGYGKPLGNKGKTSTFQKRCKKLCLQAESARDSPQRVKEKA